MAQATLPPPGKQSATDPRTGLPRYLERLLPGNERLVIVSNRGPLSFSRAGTDGSGWQAQRGSGGLVTALAELGRLAPVTWISGALERGDREAADVLEHGEPSQRQALRAAVESVLPGQDIELVLRDLPHDAWQAHYATVANPFLWFVQHQLYTLPYDPIIDEELVSAWQRGYRIVNEALAQSAVAAGAKSSQPVVLLQDYHLYLAASTIRAQRPETLLLHFNHIPWPAVDSWLILPQGLRRAICEGLLANDIVGLQTDRYAKNFLQSVDAFVRDARVDPDGRHVRWRGHTIWVRAYPISIDTAALAQFAGGGEVARQRQRLLERVDRAGRPKLIVRVDRLEPSKNALRGFLAFEALLVRRPDLRGRVRFLAIQSTSREKLPEYARYAAAVRETVARINAMADPDAAPILLLDGTDYAQAIAAMQLADVMLVNPLVDGMNLVAKEAVVVGEPALVLSETAGAAEQLAADSLMVTAADVAGTAEMLERGLEMSLDERRQHIRRLRGSVRGEDLAWWLSRQLRDLAAVASGGRPPSRALRDTVRRFNPELP